MRCHGSDSYTGTKDFAHDQRCYSAAGKLRNPIRHHVGWLHFATNQNAECHGWIVMSAGDMTASVNHYHQRRADRQWRDHTRTRANDCAANRQDQEERSDEFGDILVHTSIFTRHGLKKASDFGNETFVLSVLHERRPKADI